MFNKPQSFQFIMDLAVAFPYYLHDDHQLPHTYSPYFSHDYIDYFAILPHEWLLSLPPISIQANPNFGDRPSGPNHHDIYREGANQVREIPLEDALDSEERNGDFRLEPPLEQTIEPWKLILLYCTEPDWQLDCDLNLHWTQKLTKGSHGLRHMTFSLAGIRIGWLKESFLYYYSAAKRAWALGNQYWAWRFVARATHYLADLGHPFHTKAIPYQLLYKAFGKIKNLFQELAAMHNGHEVYAQYRFRTEFLPYKQNLIQGFIQG